VISLCEEKTAKECTKAKVTPNLLSLLIQHELVSHRLQASYFPQLTRTVSEPLPVEEPVEESRACCSIELDDGRDNSKALLFTGSASIGTPSGSDARDFSSFKRSFAL